MKAFLKSAVAATALAGLAGAAHAAETGFIFRYKESLIAPIAGIHDPQEDGTGSDAPGEDSESPDAPGGTGDPSEPDGTGGTGDDPGDDTGAGDGEPVTGDLIMSGATADYRLMSTAQGQLDGGGVYSCVKLTDTTISTYQAFWELGPNFVYQVFPIFDESASGSSEAEIPNWIDVYEVVTLDHLGDPKPATSSYGLMPWWNGATSCLRVWPNEVTGTPSPPAHVRLEFDLYKQDLMPPPGYQINWSADISFVPGG